MKQSWLIYSLYKGVTFLSYVNKCNYDSYMAWCMKLSRLIYGIYKGVKFLSYVNGYTKSIYIF